MPIDESTPANDDMGSTLSPIEMTTLERAASEVHTVIRIYIAMGMIMKYLEPVLRAVKKLFTFLILFILWQTFLLSAQNGLLPYI